MKPFLGATLAILAATAASLPARADDKDPQAILDRAIKATGGEEKVRKIEAMTWKTKGTLTINGESNAYTARSTVRGLDRYRSEFEADFQGNAFKVVSIVSGAKGWRSINDQPMGLDDDAVANEKRIVALQVIPTKLVILKEKGYKLEAAAEAKVGDRPAAGIKVTGPVGKEFTLYFDKESGLPVRVVAEVIGFDGQEFTMETTLADYKDFGGIKKATKTESKRDGEVFIKAEITEFATPDKVDDKTFAEPE